KLTEGHLWLFAGCLVKLTSDLIKNFILSLTNWLQKFWMLSKKPEELFKRKLMPIKWPKPTRLSLILDGKVKAESQLSVFRFRYTKIYTTSKIKHQISDNGSKR